MDHGPIGQRIRERNAELKKVSAGLGGSQPGRDRLLNTRIPPHQIRHESGALAVRREGTRDGGGGDAHPSASTSARSLSPRPESVTRLSPGEGFATSHAIACEDSSAGRIPSSSATRWNASTAAPSSTAS